jgi:hypothetical protein
MPDSRHSRQSVRNGQLGETVQIVLFIADRNKLVNTPMSEVSDVSCEIVAQGTNHDELVQTLHPARNGQMHVFRQMGTYHPETDIEVFSVDWGIIRYTPTSVQFTAIHTIRHNNGVLSIPDMLDAMEI